MTRSVKRLLIAALAVLPVTAFAQPVYTRRCSWDSLDAAQAEARVLWARKCGLSQSPLTTIQSPTEFRRVSHQHTTEYLEGNRDAAYSGDLGSPDGIGVNYIFSNSLYGNLANPTDHTWKEVFETSGNTPGFYKWTRPKKNNRPTYPTFNTKPDGTGTQLYPPPGLTRTTWGAKGCQFYQDKSGVTQYTGTVFYVAAYCKSGCYTPDQSLKFSDGDVNIVKAMEAKRDDLVTLTPDATLDEPRTQVARVESYTTELRDFDHPIVKVTTASGGSLSVTTEHPVLVSDGRLVKAEALRKGQALLKADGTPDPIVQIEETHFLGKVYNLTPLSTDRVANVVIAQGFLVGSGRFQNEELKYINRILLFRAVPDAIMPR